VTPLVYETARYRLELAPDGMLARLSSRAGDRWASLRLLAALDTTAGPDETVAVEPPAAVAPGVFEVARRSTRWERAAVRVVCGDDGVDVAVSVQGRGDLTDVHLLGGRSLIPGQPTGFLPSGSTFRTLFSPNPGDPGRLVRGAGESAVIGVSGDGQPGRGHWFFTPAPLSLWLTTAAVGEPRAVDEGWVGFSLAAPVERLTFVQLAYVPADRGFSLRLDYDGHTPVDGSFEAPVVTITPATGDPYAGLRGHRDDLVARSAAPAVAPRETAAWWAAPIFCGWGAQCRLAQANGARASDLATQASYDRFLDHLETERVVPGTIVVDDKWQAAYGTNEPDRAKWPDLRGWIAGRHARGQRVLLWWKAWDAEGLPPELCIRNGDGAAVAVDPTNPDTREALRRSVAAMLAPNGLDADGLKIDFTARTPSGAALSTHGPGWGIALLHELLAIVHAAAKAAKPDALLITHTPHPAFVGVTDMIRLNDMLRIDDGAPFPPIVPQMRYRAEVVRAACPELLIDTDDWCVPSLAEWRAYLAVKPELGVPSLYYADALDLTGEAFEPEDYAAIRGAWAR
jgi:hypothetical protein